MLILLKSLNLQGLKVSTIDCVHTILHQVLDLALDDDYLRYNPLDNALKGLKSAYRHETPKKNAMPSKNKLYVKIFYPQIMSTEDGLNNHIFRHTFTTRMNKQNINTKAMQSILVHADITTTMDIYTVTTKDFKIEQMQAFEKVMMVALLIRLIYDRLA